MGRELLLEDVQGACDIFGPLVDYVEVRICFDEPTGSDIGINKSWPVWMSVRKRKGSYSRSSNGRAHVGNEKSAIWLGTDLISDRAEDTTVALLEYWLVWICSVLKRVSLIVSQHRLEDLRSRKPCLVSSEGKEVLRRQVSYHLETARDDVENYQR